MFEPCSTVLTAGLSGACSPSSQAMAEHGVAALSHVPSGERVRTGPADPSGAWDQDHPPSTETTTQESGLRENRTSRLSERTEEGRQPDLLRLYRSSSRRLWGWPLTMRLITSAR